MIGNDILFGLIAFQNGYVDRSQLISAFTDWAADQSLSIADRLVQNRAMDVNDCKIVAQIVQKYQSLELAKQAQALFSSASSLHEELTRIANQGSLSKDDRDMFSQTLAFVKTKTLSTSDFSKPSSMEMDRFRIVKEHARGGLGVVFLAEDQQLRREVAVKRIRDDHADLQDVRAKFRREAEVTGQLEHPGIVPIYSMGTSSDGRPFYAMRFIRGESMQDCIDTFHAQIREHKAKMDSPQLRHLLRRFIDVCNAMEYAHEQGVLHRDLKPGNVMLGKHGETLVVDWGLAKSVAKTAAATYAEHNSQLASELFSKDTEIASNTREGSFLGTAAYASPEQLRGEIDKLSHGSDVYSLGAILFQIFIGRPPVSKVDSTKTAIEQIKSLQQRGLREFQKNIPESLAYICSKALRMEISERFETVSQLKDCVQAWLDDQPVPGMRESIRAKAGRWIRNHQTIVASSLVGLVAISGLLGLSVLAYQREVLNVENLRALINEAKEAREEKQQANVDLLLTRCQIARNRGQFLEASKLMKQLGSLIPLNEDQKLSMSRDLFYAQDIVAAWNAIHQIDRAKLSTNQSAQFDLLHGDMRMMTEFAEQGVELIRGAIASELLSPADLAYAKASIAETAEACQIDFRECIRLDPTNLNAIFKHAMTCVWVGDVNEARRNMESGLTLVPNDVRFLYLSALIAAVTCDESKTSAAIVRLKQIQGLEKEISVVELILSDSKAYEDYFSSVNLASQQTPKSSFALSDVTKRLGRFISTAANKTPTPKFSVIPSLRWNGKTFATALPSGVDLALALINGKLNESYKALNSKLSKLLPKNQWIQIGLGLTCFMEGEHRNAAVAFIQATRCEDLGPKVRTKAAWFAFGCLAVDSLKSHSPMVDSEVVELVQWIQLAKAQEGRYSFSPWTAEIAFRTMAHAKMFGIAIEIAEQELLTAQESDRELWQKRIDGLKELGDRFSKETREVANPKK